MPQTLKKQALTLTIANGFTRGLGFFFRLMTARLMGAEAILSLIHISEPTRPY